MQGASLSPLLGQDRVPCSKLTIAACLHAHGLRPLSRALAKTAPGVAGVKMRGAADCLQQPQYLVNSDNVLTGRKRFCDAAVFWFGTWRSCCAAGAILRMPRFIFRGSGDHCTSVQNLGGQSLITCSTIGGHLLIKFYGSLGRSFFTLHMARSRSGTRLILISPQTSSSLCPCGAALVKARCSF